MTSLKIKMIILMLALCAANTVSAQESEPKASTLSNRLLVWFSSDIYRTSIGFGSLKLQNPNGFDVPIDTYNDGFPSSSTSEISFDIVGETRIGWQGRQKRLWNVHYDRENYSGLKLRSVTFGTGVAIDPARAFAFGGRLAVGANVGITRSETFFDSAMHPAAELWLSTGVQLGRFTLDASVRERQALGASLDGRTASPRTQTRMISLGWLY